MLSNSIDFERIPGEYTKSLNFGGGQISITSAPPENGSMDISGVVKDLSTFHGSPIVHDLVQFGPAFNGLIGTHDGKNGLFADRDSLPDHGVLVLSDFDPEAKRLVGEVDALAQRVIADGALYEDRGFCQDYLDVARAGFDMVRHFADPEDLNLPISLERAGLVTTRLALGLGLADEVPGEIKVVTKRSHHRDGAPDDLMVSVKWRDLDDIPRIDGQNVGIADFVNPATGASALALLVSARQRGAIPSSVVHQSFMATEQGIQYSYDILASEDMGGINPCFYTLGTSPNLTPQFYLTNPAVADAGDVLCSFLPEEYQH